MDKVDCEFDEEIALRLIVIRIVQPIREIIFRTEPQHSVWTVLDPIRLFPFLHNNGPKRDT